jgi:sarcosine oxidase delta subunit
MMERAITVHRQECTVYLKIQRAMVKTNIKTVQDCIKDNVAESLAKQ